MPERSPSSSLNAAAHRYDILQVFQAPRQNGLFPFPWGLVTASGEVQSASEEFHALLVVPGSNHVSPWLIAAAAAAVADKTAVQVDVPGRPDLLLSAVPVVDASGLVLAVVTSHPWPEDLAVLAREKADLELLFDASFDEVWAVDSGGTVLWANGAMERLYGVPRDEMIGRRVEELAEQRIFWPAVTPHIVKSRKPTLEICETRVGRRLMVYGTPIFNARGDVVRVLYNSRDITELDALKHQLVQAENMVHQYREALVRLQGYGHSGDVILASPAMQQVHQLVQRVAAAQSTVLICGESGVGKQVVAEMIHRSGPRRDRPFIQIDCSTLSESLLESELFGYEKGAFTGANKNGKPGLIELAADGVLFMDEIGEIPYHLQATLLRFLEDKRFTRVGGVRPIQLDVQIVAATNRDLYAMAQQGEFRKDLYYRLGVVPIHLPPLRQRTEDILPLVDQFLSLFARRYKRLISFSADARQALIGYPWPGNVREVRHVVERLILLQDGEVTARDLAKHLAAPDEWPEVREPGAGPTLRDRQNAVERAALTEAVNQGLSVTEIASKLGVNKSTVSRKLRRWGLR